MRGFFVGKSLSDIQIPIFEGVVRRTEDVFENDNN